MKHASTKSNNSQCCSTATAEAAEQPRAALGTPGAYREFIAAALAGAQIHAGLGVTYAQIDDDVGLDYALRCLVAQTRAAFTILADLKEMTAARAKRRAEGGEGDWR